MFAKKIQLIGVAVLFTVSTAFAAGDKAGDKDTQAQTNDVGILDYGYYDLYRGGYEANTGFEDDWFYDYYEYDDTYNYYDDEWYDWEEPELFE